MKTVVKIIQCLVFLSTSFALHAQKAELKNLTAKQYSIEFNKLMNQGFRPIRVESKTLQVIDYQPGEGPQLGYWGWFEKVPTSPAWVARHGLTAEVYQKEFNMWTSQGYMPTDINIAFMDGQTRFCVIFDKIANPPAWQARHNISDVDYANTNRSLTQQGFTRTITSSCRTTRGFVYAALWVKR